MPNLYEMDPCIVVTIVLCFYLKRNYDVRCPLFNLSHDFGHVEQLRKLLHDVIHNCLDLVLASGNRA